MAVFPFVQMNVFVSFCQVIEDTSKLGTIRNCFHDGGKHLGCPAQY